MYKKRLLFLPLLLISFSLFSCISLLVDTERVTEHCLSYYKDCKQGNQKACKDFDESGYTAFDCDFDCDHTPNEKYENALIMKANEKKRKEELATQRFLDARMPRPQQRNKKYEKEFKSIFKESLTSVRINNAKILRVVIISRNWIITRNRFSGRVIKKSLNAAIAFKDTENNCKYKIVTFEKCDIGNNEFSNFSESKNYSASFERIQCINVYN